MNFRLFLAEVYAAAAHVTFLFVFNTTFLDKFLFCLVLLGSRCK